MGTQNVSSFDLQFALITPITPPAITSGATAARPALAMPDPIKTKLRDIPRRVVAAALQTESADPTQTPNVIQGYFLILSNLGSSSVSGISLQFFTTAPNPLLATVSGQPAVLAFLDLGGEQNEMQTIVPGDPSETYATVTLAQDIPANGSVIFALIPNYAATGNVVDVRGYVSITGPDGATLLLTPETRSVFGNPQPPGVSETAYALPTPTGGNLFEF
jgi:hypothetical protein